MKQHITPKQANEITEEQFYSIFDEVVKRKDWADYHHKKITIGKMIEFLETKLPTLHIDKHLKRGLMDNDRYEVFQQGRGMSSGNSLCDALWEAVKTELNRKGEI